MLLYRLDVAQLKRMHLEGFIFARVYFLDACFHFTVVTLMWPFASASVFIRVCSDHSLRFLCQRNPAAHGIDLAYTVERGRAEAPSAFECVLGLHARTEAFFFIIVSFICLCGPFILLQRHMAVIYNAHLFSLFCLCEQLYNMAGHIEGNCVSGIFLLPLCLRN